jgi:DNA polymerase III epsilon subunit family exonuclease
VQESLFQDALAHEAIWTVLDIETTGLNAKKCDITEITAITYRGGEALDIFSTLVKPLGDVPAETIAITGITADMLMDAPSITIAMSQLSAFLSRTPVIVGHNVSFDIGFLREKAASTGTFALLNQILLTRAVCTKALAQKLLPGLPSYSGIVVATQCGVKNPRAHRAENDVRMCAGILFALIDKIHQREVSQPLSVRHILAFQGVLSAR